ncbi:MAG: hypothetical protein ACKO46_02985, partial [Alphaproteobacteria bacterium]
MIPTLPKLPTEIRKLIADKIISRSVSDDEIISEYSKSYEISTEILKQIKESIQRSSTSTDIKDQRAVEDAMQSPNKIFVDGVMVVGGQ